MEKPTNTAKLKTIVNYFFIIPPFCLLIIKIKLDKSAEVKLKS